MFLPVDEAKQSDSLRRSHAFLIALFVTAKLYLQVIDQHITQLAHDLSPEIYPVSAAQQLRFLTSAGQTFADQGDKRREFYSVMVNRAQDVSLTRRVH
jgi:hypothetical protein